MHRRSVVMRSGRRSVRWGFALGVAVTLSACGNLLDVDLPGATTEAALNDPSFAPLLTLSVQAEFECAYSSFVWGTAMLGGEMIGGFVEAGGAEWMRRDIGPRSIDYSSGACGGQAVYAPMAVARALADNVIVRLDGWTDAEVPDRARLLGRANLYAGFHYAMFAETHCSASFDLGPEVLPPAMFQLAKARFERARQFATQVGDAPTRHAATVGLARVHLGLGENPAALAAATQVPAGFRMDVGRSNAVPSRRNIIFVNNNQTRRISVDPHFWNTAWMGVPDGRVSLVNRGSKTTDGQTDWWTQSKYASEASPYRLASYVEAQLIIAEISGGQTAVNIINGLHDQWNLPHFNSTNEQEILAQVVDERRREFFLEGRRFGDLRRYGGFDDWVHGTHPFLPITYGGTECFPLPTIERDNNPALSGG